MDEKFENELVRIVGQANVALEEPMSKHTTFRVGGPAQYFVVPNSEEEIIGVCDACRHAGVNLFVLGCGSNVLVADGGLRGVVLRIGNRVSGVSIDENGALKAQAGATNAKIARAALNAGFGGFEFAAGIPGSIGGAAIMNAGAYGGELRDVAQGVTCLNDQGEVVYIPAKQADWSYRHSRMADEGHLVLSVDLQLNPEDPKAILAQMDDLARRRNEKQPLDLPSAGSTFKRPEGHYAGKLIQESGMQGYSVGAAQVSQKHAGFIVNRGGAKAADVKQVIDDVQERVWKRFGVMLVPEVKLWGF